MFDVTNGKSEFFIPSPYIKRNDVGGGRVVGYQQILEDEIAELAGDLGIDYWELGSNKVLQGLYSDSTEGFAKYGELMAEMKLGPGKIKWVSGNIGLASAFDKYPRIGSATWTENQYYVVDGDIEMDPGANFTKEGIIEIDNGNGWKITTNFDPLTPRKPHEQCDVWVTYRGVLNDTPTGKAALRSYATCGGDPKGEGVIVRNLHIRGGELWDPDRTTPARWHDLSSYGRTLDYALMGTVEAQSYRGGVCRGSEQGKLTTLTIVGGETGNGTIKGRVGLRVFTDKEGRAHRTGGAAFIKEDGDCGALFVYAKDGVVTDMQRRVPGEVQDSPAIITLKKGGDVPILPAYWSKKLNASI